MELQIAGGPAAHLKFFPAPRLEPAVLYLTCAELQLYYSLLEKGKEHVRSDSKRCAPYDSRNLSHLIQSSAIYFASASSARFPNAGSKAR